MRLSELLKDIDTVSSYTDKEIGGMTHDSRTLQKGDVFFCIKGSASDGHQYAKQALEKGAAAIITERQLGLDGEISVSDTHDAYAVAASNYYGNPERQLTLIGVTGTKGKTTTTKLIKSVLETAGKKVGLIGSIQNEIGEEAIHAENTTPDAMELMELYARMVKAGCEYCVMEVSSHALDQKRIGKSHYKVAVFTNLSQDHLDYHANMEEYFKAKAKLFSICDGAVINADDPYGQRLISHASCPVTTFSMEGKGDLNALNPVYHSDSVSFDFFYQGVVSKLSFGMPGVFSVKNALAAIGACLRLGISIRTAVEGIERVKGVRGRCEIIPTGRDFTVICDHAHAPDALENVLSALKGTAKGRLVALFGCGGDRDRTKRPKMAQAAAKYADFVIITSDNPRTEDPSEIIKEIVVGMSGSSTPYVVIENRVEAIFYAIQHALPGDTIVLAGKGHEDYQIIGHEKIHLDEREVVADALQTIR